jgi:SAM-dependent methyltransferase
MTTDKSGSIAAWTAYWRTGKGASCFEGSQIEVRLTRIWVEFVDALRDGARLVDLATGNGTIARICAAHARARKIKLRIDAIDAAQIDPPKVMADPARLFSDIQFQGEIRLEALPFPDASFDAVISQFGFEYANEAQAIAEVARVLAPGGRLRFVVHARDGGVARDIADRLDRLRAVLEDHGPVTLVRTLVRALDAGDTAAVTRESAHLDAAIASVRKLAQHAPRDDAAHFYASEFLRSWALRDRYRLSDLRRSIEEGWANADGVAERQEEMLRVARSREDVITLISKLAARGLTVAEAQELRDEHRGIQIAWLINAHKPPAKEVASHATLRM